MKLLVTGGSGFIGTNAVDYALNAGYKVLNVDLARPQNPAHESLWVNVDLRDELGLGAAVRDYAPTHVLHLAAQTGMDATDLSYFSSNTDGTANLVAALKKCPSMRRLLVTSSLLVCRLGYLPKSDTDYCPPNFYGESKVITERIVRDDLALQFSWSIVRPSSVWGPWFVGPYRTFFRAVSKFERY